ncbi:uncharacterized protein LOC114725722 [Neltuma alba]|uniref:uncharacterized protein LOC114725722 n=1 Tax=Neltuma alba TaxID=207710 RepID=UPI0010A35DF9|nr:uncharacterized protein LOC114725722 [Prosopis alba]
MAAEPTIDQSSPYYIHPSENPALILVAPPLDGSNYHSWSRAMRMALLSKNKIKFADGTIPPPSVNDPMFPAWERCNNLVQGWIIKSLSPTIARSILWFDRASEIWSDLRSRYSQSDIFRIAELQEEIYSLKQGNLSVSEYYTKLKILWDELSNIRPIKPCDCGSLGIEAKHRQEDYVIRFLKGLNEQFSSVKSQLMLMDPLPSLNRSRPPGYNSSGSKSNNGKHCTYCGKPRHTEETCYRKHGFPPGFKFRSGSSATVNSVLTQDSVSAQDINTAKPLSSNQPASTASILPQLSADQYQRLLTLLSPSQSSSTASVNHLSTSVTVFLQVLVLSPLTQGQYTCSNLH